ncbi:MAG: DNA repair protein RadA [Nitrospirota bacterium]
MAKPKTIFSCQKCGYQSPKWMGRCMDCGAWDSMVESLPAQESESGRWLAESLSNNTGTAPVPINQVPTDAASHFQTGLSELDRVLGGGVVPGSVVLIGGDPGIGKSTLLLQALHRINGKTLYVSGEESAAQIKLRADRLRIDSKGLHLLAETALEEILRHVENLKPVAVVIDSIQTIYTRQITSSPGSVSQIREAAAQLMFYAKRSNTAVFIIGHVTKDGAIAGPRLLEHIVDTVLYFEGDKSHAYRLIRSVKNRFGSVHEIGVFEMKGIGLVEVSNPSSIFLSERSKEAPGSVVVACSEGERPLLIELQALVAQSHLGTARRMTSGADPNRVSLLVAVLEKRAGLHLAGQDIFVNVVSGMEVSEPAIDLGLAIAIASSFRDRPVNAQTICFGEIDLLGEVRPVQYAMQRVREAQKLGFTRAIMPARNCELLKREEGVVWTIELLGVSQIAEALQVI